jgi:hypothetical protein
MKNWLAVVGNRRQGALLTKQWTLMLYGFRTFKTINQIRCSINTDLVVIPAGYLRNASIRYCSEQAPQRRIKMMLGEWISGENCTMTPARRTILPRVNLLCQWIITA